jgi:hypothetical protein
MSSLQPDAALEAVLPESRRVDGAVETVAGSRRAWMPLLSVGLSAALTVIVADRLLSLVAPVDQTLLQTEHGVRGFDTGNPRFLVIGSSHARSFPAVRDLIRQRTGDSDPMAIVPEEGGTFAAYDWILQRRLRPLIEETDESGRLRHDRLEEVLFITTHYDATPEGETNGVVAHGWTSEDFRNDFWAHGITAQNRNYLRARWNELLPWSSLVQDRGVSRIATKIRWMLPGAELQKQQLEERYREGMETLNVADPLQRGHFENALKYLRGRGLAVTVVLFPLDPACVSPVSTETTLKKYALYVADLARRYDLRVADMTSTTPLEPGDFQQDLDHLTPAGSRRFASWALEHDLRHLVGEGAEGGEPQS